jgi:MFS family permease
MKGILDNREGNVEQHLPFKESVQSIFKSKSYIYLCLAFGATLFSFYGTNNWMPSLLSRLHGMKSNEIGTSLSLIVGGSGIVGTLIGGKLIDKYSLVNVKYFLWLPAIGNLISIPFSLVVILSSNKLLVLTFFIVPSFLNCMFLGTAFALIYRLVGNNVKALASSFFLLIANILGVTLAPFVIGTISDLLTQSMGIYSIRWALLFTIFISMISVLLFLKSSRYLTAELKP